MQALVRPAVLLEVGCEGYDDEVILVPPERCPFFCVHTDDLEHPPVHPHGLPHRIHVRREELLGHRRPQVDHRPPHIDILRGEAAARGHRPVIGFLPLDCLTVDADVRIGLLPGPENDLPPIGSLDPDGSGKRSLVTHLDRLLVRNILPVPHLPPLLRGGVEIHAEFLDLKRVRAELGHPLLDAVLEDAKGGHDRDDGENTDDDPEHGEDGAELAGTYCRKRHEEAFFEIGEVQEMRRHKIRVTGDQKDRMKCTTFRREIQRRLRRHRRRHHQNFIRSGGLRSDRGWRPSMRDTRRRRTRPPSRQECRSPPIPTV